MENIEELKQEIKVLLEKNKSLEACVEELKEQIDLLTRRLNLNSDTSSKPPSSDGLKKRPRVQSLREKGGNKTGGQKGHKGYTLEQVATPNEVIVLALNSCPVCETTLKKVPIKSIVKRQVFDIPPIETLVQEYQSETKRCPCCKKDVTAAFPEHVSAPVQYGKRVQGLAVYLHHQQFIPGNRLQMLFADIFQLPISSATIMKMSASFARKLSCYMADIDIYLRGSPVKHVDETGMRIRGKTRWLHVLSNESATYYRPSEKRGEVQEDLEGFVVHDHFKPYYGRMHKAQHVLCNAHHLRELKALIEIEKEGWAKKMWHLLRLGNSLKKKYEGQLPANMTSRLSRLYDSYISSGLAYHECQTPLAKQSRGCRKRRIGHNLLIRLKSRKEDTLRHLYEQSVPFTNNQAERDIRMMKVKQKISGGFRTFQGAELFCRTRSFLSTARKQAYNLLEAIMRVVRNKQPLPFALS